MANITITNHPLIQHKLSILRDKHTASKEFRTLVGEIAMLMCYEATRDLPLKDVEIETPVSKMTTKALAGKKLAFVPILRAGLGMVDGVLTLVPSARVGHIGLYRDPETLEPVEYYCKLPPDVSERDVIVVDPMFATGGSASAACTFLKQHGCMQAINCDGGASGMMWYNGEYLTRCANGVSSDGRPVPNACVYRAAGYDSDTPSSDTQ